MREVPLPVTSRVHLPVGNYVYAWYIRDHVVYIGVGRGSRAWAKHGDLNLASFDESEISVEILQDRLPRKLAEQIESDLIYLEQPMFNTIGRRRSISIEFIRKRRREKWQRREQKRQARRDSKVL